MAIVCVCQLLLNQCKGGLYEHAVSESNVI